jgi:hypothetical protein
MSRFIIVAFGAWLAAGGCSAPLVSCPLLADSQPHHDDCPHHKPSPTLTECPSFVAVKVAAVDAIVPANAEISSAPPVVPQFPPILHSLLQDQHNLYLSIGVLRI